MSYSFLDFLYLIGALGLFLFGMKGMSDGIQKVAGEKLRAILGVMTRNRFMGVLTGFVVTSIIQSSSATTVMVVSFVNAGLLSLSQSIGVTMGANIGTTITAWIISLLGFKVKMASIAIPLIGIGFPLLLSSRDKLKSLGEFIIGFALLFIGLEYLKDSVPDLQNHPELFETLKGLSDNGIYSTLTFILIGTVLTIIVQSSSAAMALTLVLCNNGWISFEAGAAIVLGENIGTTITANIAALIGNVHAKRAAIAHTLFNLIGVFWMVIIFTPFLNGIDTYLVSTTGKSPFTNSDSIVIGLSIFHTSFNVINTLLLVWFVNGLEKLVTGIIPSKGKEDEEFRLEFISANLLNTSEIAIVEARKEIAIFAARTKKMFNFIPVLLTTLDKKEFIELAARAKKYEDIADRMEVEIANFLVKVSRNEISEDVSRDVRSMLREISNLEKIADIIYQMSLTIERKNTDKAWFTQAQRDNLKTMFDLVNEAFDEMVENLNAEPGKAKIKKAIEIEAKINSWRDKIRDEHFVSIEKGDYNIKSGLYYNHLYSACEKMADHIFNINEAATGINVE